MIVVDVQVLSHASDDSRTALARFVRVSLKDEIHTRDAEAS